MAGLARVVYMDGKKVWMSYPKVKETAIRAIEKYWPDFDGLRFLNGTPDLHLQLEESGGKCYLYAAASWMPENNDFMNKALLNINADPYKRYRIYEKAL
jgi:hypothetical protein